MNPTYPCAHCGTPVAMADINVAADIALCRACGRTMAFSNIAGVAGAAGMDMSQPPPGVRFEGDTIRGNAIIYRKLSPMVFFLIPFTLAWSGLSMGGIYGTQLASGKFNLVMSLFGLPFLVGTVCLVTMILFGLFGCWRIIFTPGRIKVAAAVGPIAWTREISCDRDTRVRVAPSGWNRNGTPREVIRLESGGKTLKFGSGIPDDPKQFIAEAIRRTIAQG